MIYSHCWLWGNKWDKTLIVTLSEIYLILMLKEIKIIIEIKDILTIGIRKEKYILTLNLVSMYFSLWLINIIFFIY